MTETGKPGGSRRGLGSADKETRSRVASKGGKAVHEQGLAHEWKEGQEAQDAGRLGGLASGRARKERREALARQVDDSGTEALK